MNGVVMMSGSEPDRDPAPSEGDQFNEDSPPAPKMARTDTGLVQAHEKKPFITTPIYELRQVGEVKFGPGARTALLGILGGALPRLSIEQQETVSRAKKYAMEQSIKMVLMKQTLAHQQQQLASQRTQVQRQQALALMCRVYVGSISFELKEDTIRASFLPFGPIKSINMSWDPVTQKHKGFAFVEYEIPEGAQLALEQMNGAMLGGRNIKVGRPSNMPQAQQVIDEIQEEAKSYNRIYIASIHPDLTEEDIKSVFEAFGPIIYCKMSQGSTSLVHSHKGYGFVEYSNKMAADEAISSMNLFDLGGQLLRVGRSITPPNALMGPVLAGNTSAMPTAAAVAAAAATAKIQAMDAVLGISGAAAAAAPTLGLNANAPAILRTVPVVATLQQQQQQQPQLMQLMSQQMLNPMMMAAAASQIHVNPAFLLSQAQPQQPQQQQLLQQQMAAAVAASAAAAADLSGGQQLMNHHQNGNASLPAAPPLMATAAMMPLAAVSSDAQVAAAATLAHRPEVMKKVQEQQEELQKKLLDEGETQQTLQQQETMSIKGQSARHLVMQRLMRPSDSKVLILRNMVGPEDVDEDLQEEIQEECAKFGVVERVIIYKEKQSDDENDADADVIVKIFVEFSMAAEAIKAKDVLHGRYFGGRLVQAQIYDQALFDHEDLSG